MIAAAADRSPYLVHLQVSSL